MKKQTSSIIFGLIACTLCVQTAAPANSVTVIPFGKTDGKNVKLYTLTNKNGLSVSVMTYGATVVDLLTPDRNGKLADIRSLHLDRHERPVGAVVVTRHGLVRVEWLDVAGDRCWFSRGSGDAKREAVPAIEHIEAMCQFAR